MDSTTPLPSLRWLLDNCPCPRCLHPVTRERTVTLVDQWDVNGTHYEKTCNAWLANMDGHRDEFLKLFEKVYGRENAVKWWVYWRVFMMSCAELFGFNGGSEWFVTHYLFMRSAPRV